MLPGKFSKILISESLSKDPDLIDLEFHLGTKSP